MFVGVESIIESAEQNLSPSVILRTVVRVEKHFKGFSFIQTAKLAESEGTLRASGMRPGSNPGPRAPKRVR